MLYKVFEAPQKRLLRWPHIIGKDPVFICSLNPYLLLHKTPQNFYYLNFSRRWQCKVWATADEWVIWYLMTTVITNRRNRNELGIWCGTGREGGSSLTVLFAHLFSRSGELLILFDYDIGSVSWGEADLVLHLQVICDQVWLNEMCPQREKEPFYQRQLSKGRDMVHARNRKSTDCIIYLGKQGIVHCDKISRMQRVKRWRLITLISISAQLQGGMEKTGRVILQDSVCPRGSIVHHGFISLCWEGRVVRQPWAEMRQVLSVAPLNWLAPRLDKCHSGHGSGTVSV